MVLTIRPANGADSPAVANLVREVFDEYGFAWDEENYCADLYDLKGHYLDHGHQFWVAEGQGRIVGSVGLEYYEKIPGEPGASTVLAGKVRAADTDCSLERMYVHPDARRLGLGSLLMQTVLDAAKEARRTGMEIWSDKKLENAHRLYERFGALKIGDRICDDPDESPEWGFYLDLT